MPVVLALIVELPHNSPESGERSVGSIEQRLRSSEVFEALRAAYLDAGVVVTELRVFGAGEDDVSVASMITIVAVSAIGAIVLLAIGMVCLVRCEGRKKVMKAYVVAPEPTPAAPEHPAGS